MGVLFQVSTFEQNGSEDIMLTALYLTAIAVNFLYIHAGKEFDIEIPAIH